MSEDDKKEIGRLAGAVEALVKEQATLRQEFRSDVNRLFLKIDEVMTKGCAHREGQEKRITNLENAPTKLMTLGAVVISAACAFLSWLGIRGGTH